MEREFAPQQMSPAVCQGQAKAHAAGCIMVVAAPPERLKNRPPFPMGHARAGIFYFQNQSLIRFPASSNPNSGIIRALAVFAGIVNQVPQDLRYQLHVGMKSRFRVQGVFHHQFLAAVFGMAIPVGLYLIEQFADWDDGPMQARALVFQARKIQHIVDQAI
jgi:hypothetical protein